MANEPKSASTVEIPLFPLNTVLFPGGPLPLRIFEPRYVDMVRRCMKDNIAFGVVLIRAGAEAGALASFATVGTSARIVDFSQLPDGLLGISCLGERKFRVVRSWRQSDGLNMGEVEWLPAEAQLPLPADAEHLGGLLKKILPEIGGIYEQIPKRFGDASWVGCRLVELMPISMSDKQACLEIDDPLQRIERVSPLIRRVDD